VSTAQVTVRALRARVKSADVLVPFPPEWRWRAAGTSPWFPGFRIHRQDRERDWTAALRKPWRHLFPSGRLESGDRARIWPPHPFPAGGK